MTSEQDALEAEDGGADRLELVRALAADGLTPKLEQVETILRRVRIPVRVMVREAATLEMGGEDEFESMKQHAAEFAKLPVDGLVLGFARGDTLDVESTARLIAAAPQCSVTFHRAFDQAADPLAAIDQLKLLPQIDRILTTGGPGTWQQRQRRLNQWQTAAGRIKLLVGAGLCECVLSGLRNEPYLGEVHVGRAARVPQTVDGKVSSKRVAALKSALE